jgi:protein-S-isoprenylcysteine O-methyltransferase Ste14
MRYYRLIFNVFAVVTFLPILGLAALFPDQILYAPGFPWSAIMVLGELLGIAGLLVGLYQTDVWEFLGIKQIWQPAGTSSLNTSGLYRFVRHPLYTAGLIFIWLLPRMTVNLIIINIGLTLYIVVGAFIEEKKLRLEFGQKYIEYARVTPMLIPFTKWKKPS